MKLLKEPLLHFLAIGAALGPSLEHAAIGCARETARLAADGASVAVLDTIAWTTFMLPIPNRDRFSRMCSIRWAFCSSV